MAKQTYYAEPGTTVNFLDQMGMSEQIQFSAKGQVSTDNPLWLTQLEAFVRAGVISASPPAKE